MRSDYINNDTVGVLLWALTPANRLVCHVCLQTGWRIDDVLNLKRGQLERAYLKKRCYVSIVEMKTGKRSTKELPRKLVAELLEQAGLIYVFEGRLDVTKHRTRQAVFNDIKKTAAKFNVKSNVSPHSLRKNYAVYIYNKYGLERVKRELNHDNELVSLLYALSDQLKQKK